MFQGLRQLDGIVFAARIMVEPATTRNTRTPTKARQRRAPRRARIRAIMAGQPVPPDPVNAAAPQAPRCGSRGAPAWSQQARRRMRKARAATAAPQPATSTPQWLNT